MFWVGFYLFVYQKWELAGVALLMPTRGHRFTQSVAARRLLASEKSSLQASSLLQPQPPAFLPEGSRAPAEEQTVPV